MLSLLRNTRPFSANISSGAEKLKNIISSQIGEIKQAGTYKQERIIASSQSASIISDNTQVINFCANNYLGLANNSSLISEARKHLNSHGFGMSSVRFICGTQDIHKCLEQKIADFHSRDDAILYASCFAANGSLFEGILSDEDAVISDELNHASIIDGIRLCKAARHRYKHLNMEELEDILKSTQDKRQRLIATDGVFSMDGDIAPLGKIVDLAHKYNALTFIDDCHATGFFGPTGRGTEEHLGIQGKIDIINSTLGKGLGGGTGGYTTGHREIIDILRQKGRPYLFSNSVPPPIVGAAIEVFNILQDPSRCKQLRANTERFRTGMTKAGFKILGDDACPIVPVYIGDAKMTSEMADDMLKHGIYVIGFSFPVVPRGHARIRVQLSTAHTDDQIDKCIGAFIEVSKTRNFLKQPISYYSL